MLFEKTYTLRTESAEGIARYYVSFNDGEKTQHEIEVSRPVYREFERFVRVERNLIRWDERHRDKEEQTEESLNRKEQTEESLNRNMVKPPKSLEDTVFDTQRNECLRTAIRQLSETQRRRFILHHEFGLTYKQIGQMEGCTKVAIEHSVCKAKAFLLAHMKNNFI